MNTSKFFELAELAVASYANLWGLNVSQIITSTEKVKAALKLNGFSESQATEFTTNWEVVSGGHQVLTANGAGYPTGTTSMLSGRASNNFSNQFPTLGGASNFGADHARFPKHFCQYGLMAPFSLTRSAY